MPKAVKQRTGKKAAAAPYAAPKAAKSSEKKTEVKRRSPLFEKRPKNFGIGNDIQPKRDMTHFVRWPKYVKLQRQKRVLMARLKVPPAVNQFTRTLDKNTATQLFKLLAKYKPETKQQKKKRLLALAKAKVVKADKKAEATEAPKTSKPNVIKYGINHITTLVEQKKAKLVVIAHDVDPIEIVVWLPALCRKMNVPYCIVKGKSRLGLLVHKKTATAVAVVDVEKEDKPALTTLTETITNDFNNKADEIRRQWGGGKLGAKSIAAKSKKEKLVRKEEAAKASKK